MKAFARIAFKIIFLYSLYTPSKLVERLNWNELEWLGGEGKKIFYILPYSPLIVVYVDEQSWQLEKHPPLNVESLALMDNEK